MREKRFPEFFVSGSAERKNAIAQYSVELAFVGRIWRAEEFAGKPASAASRAADIERTDQCDSDQQQDCSKKGVDNQGKLPGLASLVCNCRAEYQIVHFL